MSKPLGGRPEHRLGSQEFHRAVFAAHGRECYFRGPKYRKVRVSIFTEELRPRLPHERCLRDATDAMHIYARAELGGKNNRFAFPELNGRPGCRPCHELQGAKLIAFEYKDEIAAYEALRAICKHRLREPYPR